jgi:hypothetical protein
MVAQRQASFLVTAPNADSRAILNGMPVTSDGIGGFVAASSLVALGRTLVAGICVGGLPYAVIQGSIPGALVKIATGFVALPIAQWAQITGDPGGLAPDTVYYLSPSPGMLTSTPPSDPGEAVVRVGLALSQSLLAVANFGATTAVSPPSPSTETFTAPNGESTRIIEGMPIAMASSFAKRGSASSQALAQLVGLAVVGADPTLPVTILGEGPVTLTTGQWDLITGDVGGLVAGAAYFLSPASGMTTTPPSSSGQLVAKVGRAIDSGTFVVAPKDPMLL